MEQFEAVASNVSYFVEPSPEVDKAWHDLLMRLSPLFCLTLPLSILILPTDQNIGFSKEYIQKLGRENEGIELPDGAWFGSIMVFHHLNCLVSLGSYLGQKACLSNPDRKTYTMHYTRPTTSSTFYKATRKRCSGNTRVRVNTSPLLALH